MVSLVVKILFGAVFDFFSSSFEDFFMMPFVSIEMTFNEIVILVLAFKKLNDVILEPRSHILKYIQLHATTSVIEFG